jgi:hypothetical protein
MAYVLQGIIGDARALQGGRLQRALCCLLPQGKALVPFTREFRDRNQVPLLPLTDGSEVLPQSIADICSLASRDGRVAYVEAELFGGAGTQASMLWEDGHVVGGGSVGKHAINEALRFIGVTAGSSDEFDALNLGQFRDIETWGSAASPDSG